MFLRYGVRRTESIVILDPFLHSYLHCNNLKNQTFEKNEKNTRRYYHFTHVYHKWQPSWDMEHDGHNFLSFWTIFCPFTPLTTRKIKKMKKIEKTQVDIIILHMCFINDNHIMYGSWDMEHNGYNVLSFWTILCPFALLTQCAPPPPHPHPFLLWGGGWTCNQIFKKRALTGPRLLERGC